MYGIDKTKISKLYVEYIDLNKLNSNANVSYKEATVETPFTKKWIIDTTCQDIIELEYLTIKDYDVTSKTERGFLFNEFALGVASKKNNVDIPYCTLDITIHDETDNNLNPQDVSTYHNRLERIKSYLASRYGVYISYEYAIFSSLEINITQLMNYCFNDYYHILTLMQSLAPKRYKTNPKPKTKLPSYKDYEGKIETLYISNNSTEIKIYNKSKQLDESFEVIAKGEYMRIEYKLKTSQRVSRAFGSNEIYKLTDKQILNFLHKRIYKDLIKNLDKHIEDSTKQLQKLFETEREQNKHKFIQLFVRSAHGQKTDNSKGESLDLLFDKQQIIDIVSNYDKKNKNRYIKLVNEELNKYQNDIKKFHNNFEKLKEIKHKFTK